MRMRKRIGVGAALALLLLFIPLALAANDPGHDSLYIEPSGEQNLTGSFNVSDWLRVGNLFYSDWLDILSNGSDASASRAAIYAKTGNSLYLNAPGNMHLQGGSMVYIDGMDLNVSQNIYATGSIYSGGTLVCLSNGTNCVGGTNTGNVSSITENGATPLTFSGSTGDVQIGMAAASSGVDGYLTGTDWDTFNSKGSGDVTGSGSMNYLPKWTSNSNLGNSIIQDTGNVTIDSTTFAVDATNNRVGIGTTSPTAALDVRGTVNIIGVGTAKNSITIFGGTSGNDGYGSINITAATSNTVDKSGGLVHIYGGQGGGDDGGGSVYLRGGRGGADFGYGGGGGGSIIIDGGVGPFQNGSIVLGWIVRSPVYIGSTVGSNSKFTVNGASYTKAMYVQGGNVLFGGSFLWNSTSQNVAIGSSTTSGTKLAVTGNISATTGIYQNNVAVCLSNGTNCPASGGSGMSQWRLGAQSGSIATITNDTLVNITGGTGITTSISGSTVTVTATNNGDVTGPGSSTSNAIARFDSTSGKIIKNSTVTIDDSGNLAGVGNISTGTEFSIGSGASAGGANSFALGTSSSAGGNGSYALGLSSAAGGSSALAVGSYASASADGSYAIGFSSNASGFGSTAIGFNTNATGEGSLALGYESHANNTNTMALGNYAVASGANSYAQGILATATSYGGMAIGGNSIASGENATAFGVGSTASHANSMAIGKGATTTATNQLMIGDAAVQLDTTIHGDLNTTGTIYTGGNQVCDESGNCGSSSGNISGSGTLNQVPIFTGSGTIGNSIIYANSTHVGIGITSPLTELHIEKNQDATTELRVENDATSSGAGMALTLFNNGNLRAMMNYSVNSAVLTLGTKHNAGQINFVTGDSVIAANIGGRIGSQLTGTVTVAAGTAVLTGTGTAFTTELEIGNAIRVEDEVFTVSAITNNTQLTLNSNHIAGVTDGNAYRDGSILFNVLNGDAKNQLTVLRNGDVGIGETSPLANLHLTNDQDGLTELRIDNTNSPGTMGLTMYDGSIRVSSVWHDNSNDVLTIGTDVDGGTVNLAGGNIGVGTDSPRSLLTIYGNTSDRGTLSIENADTDVQAGETIGIINFRSNENSASTPLPTDDIVARIHAAAPAQHTGGYWPTDIVFSTVNASNVLTENMRIKTGGNIGIGTPSPQQTLTVDGTANITGATYLGNTLCGAGDFLTADVSTGLLSCDTPPGGSGSDTLATVLSRGAIASATIDMNSSNLITNIGNTGTDFTSGGGLNLAGTLAVTGTGAHTMAGSLNVASNGLFANSTHVGIGTQTPGEQLHIYDGTTSAWIEVQGTSDDYNFGGFEFTGDDSFVWQVAHKSDPNYLHDFHWQFWNGTNWNFPLSITNDSRIGIGTLDPNAKLAVNGNAGTGGTSIGIYPGSDIANAIGTYRSGNFFHWSVTGNGRMKWSNGTALDVILYRPDTVPGLWLKTSEDSTRGFQIINSTDGTVFDVDTLNGRVGIGTNNPTNLLQIGDSGHSNYAIATITDMYGAVIQTGESSSPTTNPALWVRNKNNGGTATEILYARNDGSVGIGTTSPASRMHVKGFGTAQSSEAFRVDNADNGFSLVITDDHSVRTRMQTIGANYGIYDAPSNGLLVEGNVGIGTTSPGNTLAVRVSSLPTANITHSANLSGNAILLQADNEALDSKTGIYTRFSSSPGIPAGMVMGRYGSGWGTYVAFHAHPSGASDLDGFGEQMRITGDGNVGIGTTNPNERLHVVGNVTADAYFYNSDERLKDNITRIEGAVEKIQQINGVTFDWKSGGHSMGLIAQNVGAVFPELVSYGGNGIGRVQYGNLVAPLIEATKEQQEEIDLLKTQLDSQQQEIKELRRMIGEDHE